MDKYRNWFSLTPIKNFSKFCSNKIKKARILYMSNSSDQFLDWLSQGIRLTQLSYITLLKNIIFFEIIFEFHSINFYFLRVYEKKILENYRNTQIYIYKFKYELSDNEINK